MAKAQQSPSKQIKKQVSRPGVHSKKKASSLKSSKNYLKKYTGQGH